MNALTSEQFERSQRLALRLAGIELFDRHREVIARRCGRLGIDDHESLDSLLDEALAGDTLAGQRFVELIATGFTGFFRHRRQFDVAAEHALWAVHKRQYARLWSVAASTGEEPYSLAMAVLDVLKSEEPSVTILATDIDGSALDVARVAEYRESALNGLTPDERERYCGPASDARRVCVANAVRRLVAFESFNLVDPEWRVVGPFDVIMCRNVLLYLEESRRISALKRLSTMLAPDGLLILDPTEHLGLAEKLFVRDGEGIYSIPRNGRGPTDRRCEPATLRTTEGTPR